jgi:hypothetical protein
MALTVERQSSLSRKPVIVLHPLASEANMALRWEMLLSPGTVMVVRIGAQRLTRKVFIKEALKKAPGE